jgi:hypothetical protein
VVAAEQPLLGMNDYTEGPQDGDVFPIPVDADAQGIPRPGGTLTIAAVESLPLDMLSSRRWALPAHCFAGCARTC